jgi:hypothetical protein
MDRFTFARRRGDDLYIGAPGAFGSAFRGPYYVLAQQGDDAPDELDFEQTWSDQDLVGIYVFTPLAVVTDPAAFARAVRDYASGQTSTRFAWIADPSARPLSGALLGVQSGSTTQDFVPNWLNLTLTIDGGSPVTRADARGVPAVAIAGPGSVFLQSSASSPLLPATSAVALPIFGARAGVLSFSANFRPQDLANYGGDVRYFMPGKPGSWPIVQIRYPLLDLDKPVALELSIDPVAIREASRSGAELLQSGPYASFLRTNAGRPVQLTAAVDAGFSFESAPPASGNDATLYLAPRGSFDLAYPDGASEPRLLCGLSGSEYLHAVAGSVIEFIPDKPAFAPQGQGQLEPDAPRSSEAQGDRVPATTCWANVATAEGAAVSDPLFGYYAQPDNAVFYGRDGQGPFSSARTVLVSRLNTPSASDLLSFPLAPYAGIGLEFSSQPINPELDLSQVSALERLVLAPQRRQCVPTLATGPIFDPSGSQRLLGDDNPVYGLTPQGLLATVGSGGGWRELFIARDPGTKPGVKPHFVSFAPVDPSKPESTLPAHLAEAFMQPSLFLLISENRRSDGGEPALGTFDSTLSVEGFTVDLAPAQRWKAGDGAILIFKFHKGTLRDLVNDVTSWSNADYFNSKASDGSYPVQAYVRQLIDDALAHPDDPYLATFRQVVTDPEWQGVLALDTPLASNGLPKQLEGLLGGMSAPLRGHHVGVEIGHLTLDEPLANLRSSIFGLIRYPPIAATGTALALLDPTPPAVDYRVDELNVLFISSSVAGFSARVWLTANELFGRPFTLSEPSVGLPPNTIVLLGAMQRHEGEPVFSFEMDSPCSFESSDSAERTRAVSEVAVSRAVFTTLSSVVRQEAPASAGSETLTDVKARFALDGTLSFNPGAFKGKDGGALDPFGYGTAGGIGTPLPASGLNVDVQFSLSDGKGPATDREVVFAPALAFSSTAGAIPRQGSLPAQLPLTLSSFLYAPDGLTAAALGGSTCYAPQFDAARTATPVYALTFTLPLGTLGWLSSLHVALEAKVVVGWGPQTTKREEDGFTIAVQLPQVIPGFRGMNLQGVLKTSVGTANLLRFAKPDTFVLLFNDIKLSLLGFGLPPGYVVDFLIFADPKAAQASLTNLAWMLSARKAEQMALEAAR